MIAPTIPNFNEYKSFLLKHFASPGMLCGMDIVSAVNHFSIEPACPDAFIERHLTGPGFDDVGADFIAEDEEGNITVGASFFRSQCWPYDHDRQASFLAITVEEEFYINLCPVIADIGRWLEGQGIPFVVERSFRIGTWVFWIFLDRWESETTVRAFASNLWSRGIEAGVLDPKRMAMPAIADDPRALFLPWQFFSGSYFGQLFHIRGGRFTAAAPNDIPHYDLESGETVMIDFSEGSPSAEMVALLSRWPEWFGSRKVRASDVYHRAAEEGLVPQAIAEEPSQHARIIALGTALKGLAGLHMAASILHAKPSGNSMVYWLVPAESP